MQELLFRYDCKTPHETPDGHIPFQVSEIQRPTSERVEVVLSNFIKDNGKNDHVVWCRYYDRPRFEWVYFDGLEFGVDASRASEEFYRRRDTID
jgi:hypothetical protein